MSTSSDYVVLRGGLAVPVAALRLLWGLEDRGIHLRLDGPDSILANPSSLLTDEDRAAVRRWRGHVLALLAYGEEGGLQ